MQSKRKATLIGLIAVVLWSSIVGLLRGVSASLGAVGGAAEETVSWPSPRLKRRSQAGPGGALAAYVLIGTMVYFLMTSLGELAAYMPVPGSFAIGSCANAVKFIATCPHTNRT
ncbi:hypothetical protein ACH51_24015 (plasmid) [Ralstonia solanacearum]|nr:hypothetical protein ACH51_24015 [Ralstonia solanacearum]